MMPGLSAPRKRRTCIFTENCKCISADACLLLCWYAHLPYFNRCKAGNLDFACAGCLNPKIGPARKKRRERRKGALLQPLRRMSVFVWNMHCCLFLFYFYKRIILPSSRWRIVHAAGVYKCKKQVVHVEITQVTWLHFFAVMPDVWNILNSLNSHHIIIFFFKKNTRKPEASR